MASMRQLLAVVALAAQALAAPTNVRYVVHEERANLNHGFVKRERLDGAAVLPMRIGLTQTNLHMGYDLLMEVSDPASPKYGKHWKPEEVHAHFSPTNETIEAVREWLAASGFAADRVVHSENRGWFAFDATVEEAETLLLAEYHEHEHIQSGKLKVGCDRYHVPEHLSAHIDYVTPGVKFAQVVKRTVEKRARPASAMGPLRAPVQDTLFPSIPSTFVAPAAAALPPNLQTCGHNMTPACYRYLYDIPDKVDAVAGNSLGLFEQGSYFLQSDLNLFYGASAPNVPNGTAPYPALIDGARYGALPTDGETITGEADIDIDIGQSLIYPQTITLYQVDDQLYEPAEVATTNVFNTFLDALDGSYCNYSAYGVTGDTPPYDAVYPDTQPGGYNGTRQCGTLKLTPVVSASYGQAEIDLPLNYNKRQCDEFMKLGLQGHSLLFSSGDYGVGSFPGDPSANGCLGPKATIFNPQYPSGCPYITSVGATMLYPDQTVDMPESVMHVNLSQSAQNFTSSGGFSNNYAPPAYQQAALNTYFAEHKPPYPAYARYAPDINFNTTCGLYNRIGRGYPDVSANGAYLLAPASGTFYHWFGASLSSPLFASVLTLINENRAKIGKGPVGFINPALYANPGILNDITNGTNVGCGTNGFAAVKGWDPATGLGTPNYPKMNAFFLSQP